MKVLHTFAAAALLIAAASCCNDKTADEGQLLQIGDDIAIAQTQYGKIQGYIYNDVYHFLGVPYGASTAGENRFMPPVAPEPWDKKLFIGTP